MQAAHACIEAARTGLIPATIEHPHLVVCREANEEKLRALAEVLAAEGIRCALFYEPDRGGELTALCTEPVAGVRRRVFRKLQLLKSDFGVRPLPRDGFGCAREARS